MYKKNERKKNLKALIIYAVFAFWLKNEQMDAFKRENIYHINLNDVSLACFYCVSKCFHLFHSLFEYIFILLIHQTHFPCFNGRGGKRFRFSLAIKRRLQFSRPVSGAPSCAAYTN